MASATFLQNIMTGAVEEFTSYDEADAFRTIRNRGDEHWSMSLTRPGPIEPPVIIDMSDYVTPSHISGSFDRQAHWTGEYARREAEARSNALDATLTRIAASDDISQFLQAAE